MVFLNFTCIENVRKSHRGESSEEPLVNRSWCRDIRSHSLQCHLDTVDDLDLVVARSLVRRRQSCVTAADRRHRQASRRAAATVDGANGGGSSGATSSRRDVFAFALTPLKGLFSTRLKGRLLPFLLGGTKWKHNQDGCWVV